MKIYSSATWPVNPPGASPVLTREQLWNGLEVKAHDPRDFVPITACTVIENRGEQGITRRVKFVPNAGPPTSNGEATEVVTYYKPVKLEFHMVEALHDVTNILSIGKDGELYLTFVFVTDVPELPQGPSPQERVDLMGQKAAEKTLEVVRQLVVEGEV